MTPPHLLGLNGCFFLDALCDQVNELQVTDNLQLHNFLVVPCVLKTAVGTMHGGALGDLVDHYGDQFWKGRI